MAVGGSMIEVIYHPCPSCGAAENEPCRTPKGRDKDTIHDTRPFSIKIKKGGE